MSYNCYLWLFPTVPWFGLQCVIVVYPDHTHLPFSPAAYAKIAATLLLLISLPTSNHMIGDSFLQLVCDLSATDHRSIWDRYTTSSE